MTERNFKTIVYIFSRCFSLASLGSLRFDDGNVNDNATNQ